MPSNMSPSLRFLPQKLRPLNETRPNYKGCNIIVTASWIGIGFEAAVQFVHLGAKRLILAAESVRYGNRGKDAIEARTGRRGVVEVWELDVYSYESITSFTDRVNEDIDRLDVAVLTSHAFVFHYDESKYGWERTLQANILSNVLLALSLGRKMRQSETTRHRPILAILGVGWPTVTTLKPEVMDLRVQPLEAYNHWDGYSAIEQHSISLLFLAYAAEQLSKLAVSVGGQRDFCVVPLRCTESSDADVGKGVWRSIKALSTRKFWAGDSGPRAYMSGSYKCHKGHKHSWQHDVIGFPSPLFVGEKGQRILQDEVWTNIVKALVKDVPIVKELVS